MFAWVAELYISVDSLVLDLDAVYGNSLSLLLNTL